LDEPTSVLTPQAVDSLFATLRQLKKSGCSVLYISHKLDEIRALCDRCTVLRAGKVAGVVAAPARESSASLSRLMIGAEPSALQHRPLQAGAVVLAVRELQLEKQENFGVSLERVSLVLRAGEVLGIAGVSGNGQKELLAALSGEDPRARPGSIELAGHDISRAGPAERRALGLRFVPEERLGRATVPSHSLEKNALLTRRDSLPKGLLLPKRALRALSLGLIERFGVKARGPDAPAQSLSGGNLQKYVVGRELDAKPKLLIIAQPTAGVDVGAAAELRQALLELRDAGSALLVVSEELDELFELCDSLVVMANGRLSPRLSRADATRSLLGEWMGGLFPAPTEPACSS
jgi:simple sugar transport system ATP-binding protein